MAGFQGADTEALRAMAQLIARRANLVDDLRGHLALLVEDVEWVGETPTTSVPNGPVWCAPAWRTRTWTCATRRGHC